LQLHTWVLHHLAFPQYHLDNIDDFAFAILYGIIGAVAGWIFMGILEAALACLPGFGTGLYTHNTRGLALGSIAALLPLTRYFGHEELDSLNGSFPALSFWFWPWLKLAISLTVTGGWRGGFIIPLFSRVV